MVDHAVLHAHDAMLKMLLALVRTEQLRLYDNLTWLELGHILARRPEVIAPARERGVRRQRNQRKKKKPIKSFATAAHDLTPRWRFSARRPRSPSIPSARGGIPPASPCGISAATFSSRPEYRRRAWSPSAWHGV